MKHFLLFVSCLLAAWGACAQTSLNMNLLGTWHDTSLPLSNNQVYSDIWGYAANGREYAILTSRLYVHFMDVTNPGSITEIARFAGGGDTDWRDIKTYGTYAYAVSDNTQEGLMIFDLSNLPASVTLVQQSNALFNKAHNIFIEENIGRMYVMGLNVGNLMVLDVAANPANPPVLASINLPDGYVHDAYATGYQLWAAHTGDGMTVYDMTNAQLPSPLGTLDGYLDQGSINHSGWLNATGTHYIVADENHGKSLKMVDVTNLSEMTVTSLFKSTLEAPNALNSIAHNPFVLGNYCIVAYYHDGVQVFDISDPTNVVRVAYYDTYTNSNYSGYLGCWGVYPYLPSGNIIASDILNGLFVLDIDQQGILPVTWSYVRATRHERAAQVTLAWGTQAEQDNRGFWVQRRSETGYFEDLFFVPAQDNAVIERRYTAIDEDAPSEVTYYRLRQVDFDGTQHFSTIVSVAAVDHVSDRLSLFPTQVVAGEQLTVRGPESTFDYSIVSAAGQTVAQGSVAGGALQLSADMVPGSYFFYATAADGTLTALPFQVQ